MDKQYILNDDEYQIVKYNVQRAVSRLLTLPESDERDKIRESLHKVQEIIWSAED